MLNAKCRDKRGALLLDSSSGTKNMAIHEVKTTVKLFMHINFVCVAISVFTPFLVSK